MNRAARRLVVGLTALMGLAFATEGWSQSRAVIGEAGGRVSIRAVQAPLGQLLRELAALTPMDLRVDPAVEGRPVTLALDHVFVERAVRQVLVESDVDHVVVGLERQDDSVPIRVVAGDPKRAVPVPGETARESLAAVDETAADGGAPRTGAGDEKEGENEPDLSLPGQAADSGTTSTPGNMTPEQWLQALAPAGVVRQQRSGPIMLPFVGEDGKAVVVNVPPGPKTEAVLPFSDENGKAIVVPISPRSDGMTMLPFANEDGSPVLVSVPVPVDPMLPRSSPVPGVVVGTARPPSSDEQ
jgi:hypothetical protein